ncbi:MAG: tetratricopeptide repeat protein [Bdellovibrionaceae bacterium]|jgi:tetratricopeptide (TPR) repeat protein|nr:tetratricopeptide repeat protein [Pseudobdellovibrionaceae bacterium]
MSGEDESLKDKIQLCQLLLDAGDLIKSATTLKKVVDSALAIENYKLYLEAQTMLIRIHAERNEFELLSEVKDQIQEQVINNNLELNSKTHYTLGVSSMYKGNTEQSQKHHEQALQMALKSDGKEDICYAIYGLATVYWKKGQYDLALKEIYNLSVLFQAVSVPKLEIASMFLNAGILRHNRKYEQAIDIYWQIYDKIKVHKNLFLYLKLMFFMGAAQLELGDKSMAKVYLDLARKSVDAKNLVRLHSQILEKVQELGDVDESRFDLILKLENNQVFEKAKGKVDFKSQFILLDLLKLFVQRPGEVYSKEDLVKHVWKQDYNPSVHDNKVYVTIKRLRKLIEPDYDRPKYIFRAKNGYFLNKNINVSMN